MDIPEVQVAIGYNRWVLSEGNKNYSKDRYLMEA